MDDVNVIEIEKQILCDIGAPIPTLFSDEHKVYLRKLLKTGFLEVPYIYIIVL